MSDEQSPSLATDQKISTTKHPLWWQIKYGITIRLYNCLLPSYPITKLHYPNVSVWRSKLDQFDAQ
jgi:hypothetical protein